MASSVDEDSVEDWCNTELSKLLKVPSEEIARYVLGIENEHDLDTILNDVLVDVPDLERREFVSGLKSKTKCVRGYRKSDLIDFHQEALQKKNAVSKKKNKLAQNQETNSNSNGTGSHSSDTAKKEESSNVGTHKKKAHYVSIYSPEGRARDIVLLPGRNSCTCLASKHDLINNCLSCGRIVCKQEGSGPCFTCHEWVGTPAETLTRKTKEYRESHFEDESLIKAREQRDRLILNSENYEQGTKVIDDQTDFYTSENTKWMSDEERKETLKAQELRDQQKAARKAKKYTIDFAGRNVIECDEEKPEAQRTPFQDIIPKSYYEDTNKGDFPNVAPNIETNPPIYVGDSENHVVKTQIKKTDVKQKRNVRLQDADLQLMGDDGMCLSMHQPWASLLISGIKPHEGRSWYTPHRGCLWIHAAKKEPTAAEIKDIEGDILCLDEDIVFPKNYPSSCLLGSVTVVDCLPQEEYRKQYPYGQSGAPYVFICENPQELMPKLPMSGKHKIFKMDANVHFAAKKMHRKPPAHN